MISNFKESIGSLHFKHDNTEVDQAQIPMVQSRHPSVGGGGDLELEHMDVSENKGTPKSSTLIGVSIINHPFWGTPILGNPHM